MYNEVVKTRFINQYTDNLGARTAHVYMFNQFEKFEKEWGADLCTRDKETLQVAIDRLAGFRMKSNVPKLAVLREYVKWCIANGIPGACDGMLKIKEVGLTKIRLRTVASPAHLQQYMDKLLAPAEDKTTDCIYRCYLWLAYCGADEEDILNVKCSDVDLSEMVVRCGDDDIPLYRESFSAFRTCATSEHFAHGTPGTPGYRLVSRIKGDQLLRGVRTMVDSYKLSIQMSRKSAEKFGKDGMRISFKRARISGIFYRMYERERIGVPVDFSDVVDHDMEGKEYKTDTSSFNSIRNKQIRNYEEDYARWKMAYSI